MKLSCKEVVIIFRLPGHVDSAVLAAHIQKYKGELIGHVGEESIARFQSIWQVEKAQAASIYTPEGTRVTP